MEHVLLVVQVLLAIALIAIILLQRSDSDGFGLGSGSGSNLLSGRATANLLTRTTAILAGLFMLNALLLSVIAAHNRPASIIDTINQEQSSVPVVPAAGVDKTPSTAAKTAPAAPATSDKKPEVAPAAANTPEAPVKKPAVKHVAKPVEAPVDENTDKTND